jgi:hypothetical protein
MGACAVLYLIMSLFLGKSREEKRREYTKWGLGTDCCCFYSRRFTVANQNISIHGFQEVVDKKSAIRYSLVKMKKWGKRKVYAQCFIQGNYKDSNSFQVIMDNIPYGEDYQIEVYSGFNLSYGQFQVKY